MRFLRYLPHLICAISAWAQCPRPPIGGIAAEPPTLRSVNGVLQVDLTFRTGTGGPYPYREFCYLTADNRESPTLRVRPGDHLILRLKNEVLAFYTSPATPPVTHQMDIHGPCGGGQMFATSTNLHFHGMHVPPTCHADEVISTLVQPSGGEFEYHFTIPNDQPPGLYWYHPHPHGFTEHQVLGGASGALVVEGIEGANPKVAGLPERILVLRDMVMNPEERGNAPNTGRPGKNISLNYVAVVYPSYQPAVIPVRPSQREFWRVLNASADTFVDLQVRAGSNPAEGAAAAAQQIDLVALDGAPLTPGALSARTHLLVPPAGRAEFIVETPPAGKMAQLVSLEYHPGILGEAYPFRPIAEIKASPDAPETEIVPPGPAVPSARRDDLRRIQPARLRKLYFSEIRKDPNDRKTFEYYITVEGRTPKAFDMHFKEPDITVMQGTVEDWVIQNRSEEVHTFHIHQTHFLVLERDGKPVDEPLRDTIELPFWDGKSAYPSVKLRIDFRSPEIIGTFLYHCHILEHEDGGMMGSIRVVKRR